MNRAPWLLFLVAVPAFCAEQDDIVYQNLVQRVEDGDFTVDFRALRLACIKSSQCEPRGNKADLAAMNRAVNDHDPRRVIETAEHLISLGFVDIEARATSVTAYREINDPRRLRTVGTIMISGKSKIRKLARTSWSSSIPTPFLQPRAAPATGDEAWFPSALICVDQWLEPSLTRIATRPADLFSWRVERGCRWQGKPPKPV
jgi:hypothetical protein